VEKASKSDFKIKNHDLGFIKHGAHENSHPEMDEFLEPEECRQKTLD